MRRIGTFAWVNLATKAALVALLLVYAARPDLPQFAGKAMLFRSGIFPVLAAALPVIWLLRGRPLPYPHLPDALLVMPLVVDTAGNSVDMYRFTEFGWAVHGLHMALITTGLGMLLATRLPGRAATGALVLGIGSVLHTLWEIFEWVGVEAFGLELDVRYTTTMGDFATALAGSGIGAALTVTLAWPRPRLGGALFSALPPQSYEGDASALRVGADRPRELS